MGKAAEVVGTGAGTYPHWDGLWDVPQGPRWAREPVGSRFFRSSPEVTPSPLQCVLLRVDRAAALHTLSVCTWGPREPWTEVTFPPCTGNSWGGRAAQEIGPCLQASSGQEVGRPSICGVCSHSLGWWSRCTFCSVRSSCPPRPVHRWLQARTCHPHSSSQSVGGKQRTRG